MSSEHGNGALSKAVSEPIWRANLSTKNGGRATILRTTKCHRFLGRIIEETVALAAPELGASEGAHGSLRICREEGKSPPDSLPHHFSKVALVFVCAKIELVWTESSGSRTHDIANKCSRLWGRPGCILREGCRSHRNSPKFFYTAFFMKLARTFSEMISAVAAESVQPRCPWPVL